MAAGAPSDRRETVGRQHSRHSMPRRRLRLPRSERGISHQESGNAFDRHASDQRRDRNSARPPRPHLAATSRLGGTNPTREFPRLCRGGSRSLTVPGIRGSRGRVCLPERERLASSRTEFPTAVQLRARARVLGDCDQAPLRGQQSKSPRLCRGMLTPFGATKPTSGWAAIGPLSQADSRAPAPVQLGQPPIAFDIQVCYTVNVASSDRRFDVRAGLPPAGMGDSINDEQTYFPGWYRVNSRRGALRSWRERQNSHGGAGLRHSRQLHGPRLRL